MSTGIVAVSKEAAALAFGQLWFVLTDQQTNNVDLYEIKGLWGKVVCLSRPTSGALPRYYLLASLRFVEQVQKS